MNLQHSFQGEGACPTLNAELDILEGQGSQPRRMYTTLHRNTAGRCGIPDTWKPSPNYFDAASNLTGTWHTYAVRWTPTDVKWYLDDVLVNQTPVYDSTNQPQFMILSSNVGGWMGEPDATTPDNLVTDVDWVRVWQR
jgi:beta-glucanase (GH16 family)